METQWKRYNAGELWKQVSDSAAAAAAAAAAGAGYVQIDAELENTTCYELETVRIKCDITGYPLPRYRWYKDGVVIDRTSAQFNDARFNIKTTPWGSRCAYEYITCMSTALCAILFANCFYYVCFICSVIYSYFLPIFFTGDYIIMAACVTVKYLYTVSHKDTNTTFSS